MRVWWDSNLRAWNHSYDHRSLRQQADLDEILNYFGGTGWELVAYLRESTGTSVGMPVESGYVTVWKRRKP